MRLKQNNNAFNMVKLTTIISMLFLFCFQLKAFQFNAPHHLKSFDKTNPIGTNDQPYFGWRSADIRPNEIQTAYQILVASSQVKLQANVGDVWDSGKVASRQQNYVYAKGQKLSAATQYYWKVRTWDKADKASLYSSFATFSTGLLQNEDWSDARWIKRPTEDKDDYTYYRKTLHLPNKSIKRAVVYISASHNYELFINGNVVGKGFNHHYPQYTYNQAWDVTQYLKTDSENLFSCFTHWYGGGQGRAAGAPGLLFKTIIEYTDSTVSTMVSDKTWKSTQATQWATNQAQRNGEGIGRVEKIDSRKSIQSWNQVSFNDREWSSATEIGPHPIQPWTGILRSDLTRVIEQEIKPQSITRSKNGKYIIDLGKIYAGNFKIAFDGGNAGDTVKMKGGFVLNGDGTVSEKVDQQTNLDFSFVLNGKNAIFNPIVYLGIRFLQIDNSPNVLTKNNVSFVTRHYELNKKNAYFESSNSMLNKVWELMVHSLMVGVQEGFVDTPTREKGAFLGDSWLQAVPSLSVFYDRSMTLRALNEFLDSQDQYWPDGRLNAVYPNNDGGRDIPDYTLSYLIWVWDYYLQTGHEDFLRSNYARLKKIADYADVHTNKNTGLIQKLTGGKGPYEFGIVDWPADMRYGYDMAVESRTVIQAYTYADFMIMAKIADLLDIEADKSYYANKAKLIKQSINQNLINDKGIYIDGLHGDNSKSEHASQHANIMPFALDIAPDHLKDNIINQIKAQKMAVGMICLIWLPEALGKANEGHHLFDLYTNTSWNGWAKTIKLGGTVTWESWNANENNQSLSHPWGAVGLLGIQNHILGIKAVTSQHDQIEIKPLDFGDKLTYAKGIYKTDKGDVFVHWQKHKNKYILKIKVPHNITAKVYIPKFEKSTKVITLNGKKVDGSDVDTHILIDNVGSGDHVFIR